MPIETIDSTIKEFENRQTQWGPEKPKTPDSFGMPDESYSLREEQIKVLDDVSGLPIISNFSVIMPKIKTNKPKSEKIEPMFLGWFPNKNYLDTNDLINLYFEEKARVGKKIESIESDLDNLFLANFYRLLAFNYKDISLEITPFNALFFDIIIGKFDLHLKLHLNNDAGYEAFFAIYDQDRRCLINGAGNTLEAFSDIYEYIANELSFGDFTKIQF